MKLMAEMTETEFNTLHDGTVQPPEAGWNKKAPWCFKRSKGERWFLVKCFPEKNWATLEFEIRRVSG